MYDRLLRPAMVAVSKKHQKSSAVESAKESESDNADIEKNTKN